MKLRLVSTLWCAAALSGCYTTTISNGKPAAPAVLAYDQKWHHGLVWGIAELSGPYDLGRICPGGWAEIKTETSFVNGVADAVTSGIYAPQTIWVRCAATPAVAPPPPPPAPPAAPPAAGSP